MSLSISGFFYFFLFFFIFDTCHFTVVSRVKMTQFSPNFCKNEAILSFLKLTLNLLFYKFYGDILTKINVLIKYFYKYFKLILNSTQNIIL